MTSYAYQSVVDDMRRGIADGRLTVGMRLPTTTDLCQQYGVSKITIKRAMDELMREGLVSRRRGSGTYVKRSLRTAVNDDMQIGTSDYLDGFSQECADHGVSAGVHLSSFSICEPPTDVREELSLAPSETCYRIERTLLVDDVPFSEEVAYVSTRVARGLRPEHARMSLFGYLEHKLGLHIASSHRSIVATHPSDAEAQRLDIRRDEPVLKVFQTNYLDDGTPLERSELLFTPGYEFYSISSL